MMLDLEPTMNPVPETRAVETLDQRVERLLATWRAETAHYSSSSRMTGHPAYQEIIALGRQALPSLFRDLEHTGDGHLAKALTAITGAQPVPAEDAGYGQRVAEAWLRWARENGQRW
jgi:hypothetical protein